jgi:hypothetical protein
MRRSCAVLVLLFAGVVAAPSQSAAPSSQTSVTRESRPVRLLRTWYDSVKTPDGDVVQRVDMLYDYRKAAAFERVYGADGRLIRERRIVVNPPTPSQEEIQEAFEIVRADPEFARVIDRFKADLEGGFVIEEGRGTACGPGARCLLIQLLSPDHSGLIRVVGVDLVKRSIPYRLFVPSEHPGVK